MVRRLRLARRLVRELPGQLRLAYCLVLDPRVPARTKAILAAPLGLAVLPALDLPRFLQVVGEVDVVAVLLLSLRLFIAACPSEVVAEQQQLIVEQRSRFDSALRSGERAALALWERLRPLVNRATPATAA